jgi:hypothetical protein
MVNNSVKRRKLLMFAAILGLAGLTASVGSVMYYAGVAQGQASVKDAIATDMVMNTETNTVFNIDGEDMAMALEVDKDFWDKFKGLIDKVGKGFTDPWACMSGGGAAGRNSKTMDTCYATKEAAVPLFCNTDCTQLYPAGGVGLAAGLAVFKQKKNIAGSSMNIGLEFNSGGKGSGSLSTVWDTAEALSATANHGEVSAFLTKMLGKSEKMIGFAAGGSLGLKCSKGGVKFTVSKCLTSCGDVMESGNSAVMEVFSATHLGTDFGSLLPPGSPASEVANVISGATGIPMSSPNGGGNGASGGAGDTGAGQLFHGVN